MEYSTYLKKMEMSTPAQRNRLWEKYHAEEEKEKAKIYNEELRLNREKYENAQKKHERYLVWINTRTWQE